MGTLRIGQPVIDKIADAIGGGGPITPVSTNPNTPGGQDLLVVITSSENVSPNKWRYKVRLCKAGDQHEVKTFTAPMGEFDAYNTVEFSNDETTVNGIDITCTPIDGVLAIPNGTPVLARKTFSSEVGDVFFFEAWNQWDVEWVGVKDDDSQVGGNIRNINIINEHGPDDREDFDISPTDVDDCPSQADIEWNGIDIIGYAENFLGIRELAFSGASFEGGTRAVSFVVDDVTTIRASITGYVEQYVSGDDWIDVSGLAISHNDAQAQSQTVTISYVDSVSCDSGGLSVSTSSVTLGFDDKGHFTGSTTGS